MIRKHYRDQYEIPDDWLPIRLNRLLNESLDDGSFSASEANDSGTSASKNIWARRFVNVRVRSRYLENSLGNERKVMRSTS